MHYSKVLIVVFLSMIMLSCGTDSEPEPQGGIWEQKGLENHHINALEYSQTYLYAASKEHVLRSSIQSNLEEWEELDLEINTETSEFGDVLFTDEALYAVVRNTTDYEEVPNNFVSLYRSIDMGESWEPLEIELEGARKPYVIYRIAKQISTGNLYAYGGYIFKSTDGGITWANLTEDDDHVWGFYEFLYVSKDHPNQIWAGGWNSIFSPDLAKSDDGGESWTSLNEQIYFNTEATLYAAVIHPEHEQTVLVGLGGGIRVANVIRKSTDGGQNWTSVLEGYNIRALKNGLDSSNRVYASGISESGKLFVAISDDYGDSWDVEEYDEGPSGIRTTDLLVTEVNGNETLIFGTNAGVYSLTLE